MFMKRDIIDSFVAWAIILPRWVHVVRCVVGDARGFWRKLFLWSAVFGAWMVIGHLGVDMSFSDYLAQFIVGVFVVPVFVLPVAGLAWLIGQMCAKKEPFDKVAAAVPADERASRSAKKERFVQVLVLLWTVFHVSLWVCSGNVSHPLQLSGDCWPFDSRRNLGGYPDLNPLRISIYDIRPLFIYIGMGAITAFIIGQSALAKWIGCFLALLLVVIVAGAARTH